MKKKKMFIIVGGIVLLTLIASVLLATSTLFATVLDTGGFGLGRMGANVEANEYWEVEINQTLDNRHIEDLGGPERLTDMLIEQIKGSLSRTHAEQVEYSVKVGEKTESGVVVTTYIRGRNPQIIGSVLYDDLHELFNILAGPIHLTMTGETKAGAPLTLNLLTNSSTGYGWDMMQKTEIVSHKEDRYWAKWEVYPGVPEIQTLDFVFDVSGNVEFNLDYTRPWERPDSWQKTRIQINQLEFIDIFDLIPTDPNFGGVDPYAVAEYEAEYKWDSGGLPKTYNWITADNRKNRALDLVVGDQGACGTCWAFATTGVTEAAYQVQRSTGSYDLSEQYLVACNTRGVRCGGWNDATALEYFIDQAGLNNNPPGAVLDVDMPYDPSNFDCSSINNHNHKAASWHMITADPENSDSLSAVPELKAAIREYGPIAVGVCGSGVFKQYTGGVFDANNCQNLNHAVLLVGWNDNDESWIMKNSWGTNWGENGYMRIKWGTNRIGSVARFVIVP